MEIAGVTLDLQQGQGAGLQSRHPRGSHRAGEIGAVRLAIFRRAGALRAGRLRPHRRRGQSAGQAEIPILDRRPSRTAPISTTGSRRRPSIRAPGGRIGSNGSRRRTTRRAGARDRRRQAQADRGRAGQLREGEKLDAKDGPMISVVLGASERASKDLDPRPSRLRAGARSTSYGRLEIRLTVRSWSSSQKSMAASGAFVVL